MYTETEKSKKVIVNIKLSKKTFLFLFDIKAIFSENVTLRFIFNNDFGNNDTVRG